MYSAGLFATIPGMREALTGAPQTPEWLAAAKDRGQRRMHSADTESLQSQVEQLRQYVAVLFQLLVGHGICTVEEAQRLVGEMASASSEPNATTVRDVVTGMELPPEENPFLGLGDAIGHPKKSWRERVQPELLTAVLLCGTTIGVWVAWLAGWVRF